MLLMCVYICHLCIKFRNCLTILFDQLINKLKTAQELLIALDLKWLLLNSEIYYNKKSNVNFTFKI